MKFTYYTIIGKDINLLKGHVENVKQYAGFDKLTCEKEFIIIIYENARIPKNITEELWTYCRENDIRVVRYREFYPSFIHNLYMSWNLGYSHSDDGYVFRGGSDQFFSKDSFVALYEAAENLRAKGKSNFILQANTIENSERSPQSRHYIKNFGDTFENFKLQEFEQFCDQINEGIDDEILTIEQCLEYWNKPTPIHCSLGTINRVDGCSWLMTKKDWETHGPLKIIEGGITGDVLIHDVLQSHGYEEYIVRDCITYHFVRGESLDVY